VNVAPDVVTGGAAPLVSVVMATYGRPAVLATAIESVLAQSVGDWELLVVGDACTDRTADVVASYDDPRIRWHNLEANVGDQSGPNTVGASLARGRYLAYLNHDDLWLPEHLALALEHLELTGADLVFTLGLCWKPDGDHTLTAAVPGESFTPGLWFVPASFWVMRRELVARVGPWRHRREIYAEPSQDWLYRAWRSGADLRLLPRVTGLAVQSGRRAGSYADPDDAAEHRALLAALTADRDGFLVDALTAAALAQARTLDGLDPLASGGPLRHLVRQAAARAALALGRSPLEAVAATKYRRRGEHLARLRERRGLQGR
jgi:glycosyltransferase involved in cell wall biosynthesis